MAVTITNQSGVVFTFQDGDVSDVTTSETSSIEQYGIPSSGYTSAQVYDYEGVLKTISINGVLTTATTSRTSSGTTLTIAAQKTWLEGLQNGYQIATAFVSTYESCTVVTSQFRTKEIAGIPGQLQFTLTLAIGS